MSNFLGAIALVFGHVYLEEVSFGIGTCKKKSFPPFWMERSPLNLKDFALAYETISPFWAKIGIQWMNLCCLNTPSSWKHPRAYISQRSTIFTFISAYIFPRCVRSMFLISFWRTKMLGNHCSDLWDQCFPTKPTWCAYHFKMDMIPTYGLQLTVGL